MMVSSMEFLTLPMFPPPEMSITQASIKHTAKVIIAHIVPFALQDCLKSALLNIFFTLLFIE